MADPCDMSFMQKAAEEWGKLQKQVERTNIRLLAQMDQWLAMFRDLRKGELMTDAPTVYMKQLPDDSPFIAFVVCGIETMQEAVYMDGIPQVGTDCDAVEVYPMQQDVWEVRVQKSLLYDLPRWGVC